MTKQISLIWRFFIEKRTVAFVAMIGIIIAGLISFFSLPREIQPEINIPFVVVSVGLPGASPADTESLITEPLEKEISKIDGIKTLSGSAGFGFSSTFIEFEANKNIDEAFSEVKDAVDMAKINFPEDATAPSVQKIKANEFAVITFSIIGNIPIYELTNIAEEAQTRLEKIASVASVGILNGQKKYIKISLDPEKLDMYKITADQVAKIIKISNNNLPVGLVKSENLNYSVRVDNTITSLTQLKELPLFALGDENKTQILLGDIATIEEALPESIISRVSTQGQPSRPAVSLQVFKKNNTDITKVAHLAKEEIEKLQNEKIIPDYVQIAVTNDNSIFVEEELGVLTSNGIQTAILIIISLFLAFGLTQGIIAGITIPVILLMTFPVLDMLGMTFNILSLFSLVISLGIVIDTAIVIMGGIADYMRKGFSPKESAILSVDTYKWPLVAGTFTTVFAFFPMLLVSGIMGEFMKTMPITIGTTLIASLFFALTIAPSLASKFLEIKKVTHEYKSILRPFFEKSGQIFQRLVKSALNNKTTRRMLISGSVGLFALSLLLPVTGLLKIEMFPQTDQNYFTISVELPKGIAVEETNKITQQIEKFIYEIPEVENFITQIGTTQTVAITEDNNMMGQGGITSSNQATITINLIHKNDRDKKSYEISEELRGNLKDIKIAKIEVNEMSEGPPGEAPITVRITGKNLDELKKIAEEIKQITESIPGTLNTKLSLEQGINEIKFTFNKNLLAFHGISALQAASIIRNAVQGIKAATIKLNDEEIDVIVKYDLNQKEQNIKIADLKNLQITTPKGYNVSVEDIAEFSLENSPNSIDREGQKRIVKVISDIEQDENAVEITREIEEKIAQMNIPSDYDINFGGDLQEIEESFKDLFKSFIVGIILIALTLVLMFNSFSQAFVILLTLPLALIGVFPGLFLLGLKLTFPAFLGIVALSGMVVNNAIVLLDRINESINDNVEFKTAIAESAYSRMEPIFMTSITTIIGVVPLAFVNEFWAGLSVSIAFGMIFSTALTLLIIPTIYFVFERRKYVNK